MHDRRQRQMCIRDRFTIDLTRSLKGYNHENFIK
jgi:hypothetical protein